MMSGRRFCRGAQGRFSPFPIYRHRMYQSPCVPGALLRMRRIYTAIRSKGQGFKKGRMIMYWESLPAFCGLIAYTALSFSYMGALFGARLREGDCLLVSCAVNCLIMGVYSALGLPLALTYLITYLVLLVEHLLLYRCGFLGTLFATGMFLFHLICMRMIVISLFSLICGATPWEILAQRELYYASLCTTMFGCALFVLFFRKVMELQTMLLLLGTPDQLRFVVFSLGCMNLYLLILSLGFDAPSPNRLLPLFHLSTAFILFAAFYTIFRHSTRMCVLLEYRSRSRQLLRLRTRESEELRAFAFNDELTGLYNRRFGQGHLEEMLSRGRELSVCFLDLDHLKLVNDRFGHKEGDEYILAAAGALREAFGGEALLCRMGGDEFMALLPGVREEEAHARCGDAAGRLQAFSGLYHPGYDMSLSYGVVHLPAGTKIEAEQVLQLADERMYRHKVGRRAAR
ncbi:MAG: hypothetical protein DBX66_03455 [Clostridiales bacterium]|nr:MAG: hypothetical protein DBX66_03455 [Clostridiales bacterium]